MKKANNTQKEALANKFIFDSSKDIYVDEHGRAFTRDGHGYTMCTVRTSALIDNGFHSR